MDEIERNRKEFRYETYEQEPSKALKKAGKWLEEKEINKIVDIQISYGNFGYVLTVSWVTAVVKL